MWTGSDRSRAMAKSAAVSNWRVAEFLSPRSRMSIFEPYGVDTTWKFSEWCRGRLLVRAAGQSICTEEVPNSMLLGLQQRLSFDTIDSRERSHPHSVRDRAGRPARRRAALAARLRRTPQAGRARGWPRRSRDRPCRPRPWSTRPTFGCATVDQPEAGTPAATSSPPRPRPCDAS